MGCDIHGYLEIKAESGWHPLKPIPRDRSYDSFGVLFGVRNYVGAIPIAPERGLPNDISRKVKKESDEWDSDGHSHTWLSVADVKNYDWEQKSIDGRVSTIDKMTGAEVGKASYTYLQDDLEEQKRQGVYLTHLERRAGEHLSPTWAEFLKEMKILAENYGDDGVRVVVWFDN